MAKFKDSDYSYKNILEVYHQATAEEIREGLKWYTNARQDIQVTIPYYTKELTCALVSALSPHMPWEVNIISAKKVADCWLRGGDINGLSIPTFKANKCKAWYLLERYQEMCTNHTSEGVKESLSAILKGNKTTAFYLNLLGDESAVTIDGHATFIAKGEERALSKTHGLTDRQYAYISGLYELAARLEGIQPHQMQAITWLTYRRLRGL